MKRRMTTLAVLAVAAAAVTTAVTFAVGGGGSPTSGDEVGAGECSAVHNVEACDGRDAANGGVGVAPVCAPEVPDCQDTIVIPDGGSDSADEPASPDGPPVTSGDGIAPDECSLVHNIDACQEQAVALAKKDMMARLGAPETAVKVISVELVEWPDSCLGIAKLGMACLQVITPGFRIILDTGLIAFEYHSEGAARVELVQGIAQ